MRFAFEAGADAADFPDGQERADFGLLCERRNKIRKENVDGIDFAFEEKFLGEFRNGASFSELRGVFVSEFSRQVAFSAADELSAFFTRCNMNGFVFIELADFAS